MSSVSGTNSSSNTGSSTSTASTTSTDTLGKDAFLRLLVTQMKNQDPLSPTDNTEFIAQLAQFSSLEQMQNLNTTATTISQNQQILQGASLVGKTVTGKDAEGDVISGTCSSVTFTSSATTLNVAGNDMDLGDVTSVK